MSSNLGRADRIIRFFAGALLVFAPLISFPTVWSNANFAYVAMVVGIILMLTSLLRFCPLYRLIGVSTCKP